MELTLKRQWYTVHSTIGELLLDGKHVCYTLEDVARPDGVKIPKETAIPAGRYLVVLDFSQRFQRTMPHVMDVPLFTGIRMHSGNDDQDTEGCVLLAMEKGVDVVLRSREAYQVVFNLLEAARRRGDPVYLTVENCANQLLAA